MNHCSLEGCKSAADFGDGIFICGTTPFFLCTAHLHFFEASFAHKFLRSIGRGTLLQP